LYGGESVHAKAQGVSGSKAHFTVNLRHFHRQRVLNLFKIRPGT